MLITKVHTDDRLAISRREREGWENMATSNSSGKSAIDTLAPPSILFFTFLLLACLNSYWAKKAKTGREGNRMDTGGLGGGRGGRMSLEEREGNDTCFLLNGPRQTNGRRTAHLSVSFQ